VATPLEWEEVAAGLDPKAFTVETVPGRVRSLKRDPWSEMDQVAQRLPALPSGDDRN
jgi:bifunctional non-homologous end joining protein LigD